MHSLYVIPGLYDAEDVGWPPPMRMILSGVPPKKKAGKIGKKDSKVAKKSK